MATTEIDTGTQGTGIDAAALSTADIAKYLRCSIRSIQRLRDAGDFPSPVQLTGTLLRWRRADIDTWLSHRVAKASRCDEEESAR